MDTTGAEGVLFKQGGAHGGHVLFIQDGRLHYVYNFLGERQQLISSAGAVPLGRHLLGVRYSRTGTVRTATRRWVTSQCTSTTTRSVRSRT